MSVDVLSDPDAERCVVGACLVSPTVAGQVGAIVAPSDFISPNARAAFGAICRLHARGDHCDAMTVEAELRAGGEAWEHAGPDLVSWQINVPSVAGAPRYAALVAECAARRALHQIGDQARALAADPAVSAADGADELRARLASIDSPVLAQPPGDVTLGDFLAEADEAAPWVIPGLLTQDARAIIVAPEGVGKSELTRQLVTLPAYGIHPFTFTPIPPVPTLLVDLENPRAIVRARLQALTSVADAQGAPDRAPLTLWHRPGGVDLRRRADRSAFEDVLRRRRPLLVALCPVYKAYARRSSETDEQVAAELQAILDDLRSRYGFALVLEHHAPQANGGYRDVRPFGSSLWLRWPEFGLGLIPDSDSHGRTLKVKPWRGHRDPSARWPNELHRGDTWPWVGHWDEGVPA